MIVLRVHENSSIKGGSEVYIRDVSAHLEEEGVKNILLFVEEEKSGYKITFNKIIKQVPDKELIPTLTSLLQDIRIDLVHVHGISNIKIIEFLLANYKVIRTMHEPRLVCPGYGKFWINSGQPCTIKYGFHCFKHAYTESCFRSRKPWNVLDAYLNTEYEVKVASKRYSVILTMSDYVRNEAIKGGIEAEKIICNPHFTNFNLPYTPFEGNQKRFLFVGRLIIHKGIYELMEASLEVLKNNQDVFLDIVGDGPLRDYVKTFVSDNKLENKVRVHTWKSSDEISSMMMESYCVLLPSIYPEAFGLVGIEAAVHSKPVIAFDRGGIATWLKNDFNGYLLKNATSTDLAFSMDKLLKSPVEYELLSRNAWEWSTAYFTPRRHVDKLLDIYKSCIEQTCFNSETL